MKNLNTHRVFQVIRWIPPQFHFFIFWHTTISRHLINERDFHLGQITLFLSVDPSKSGILPATRQSIQWGVDRPQLLETFTLPQLFLVEWKSIWLICCIKLKLKSECLENSPSVGFRHCWFVVVTYLHYEFNRPFLVSERQFVYCVPFENIKAGSRRGVERSGLYVV
jgi:hypothetical protein